MRKVGAFDLDFACADIRRQSGEDLQDERISCSDEYPLGTKVLEGTDLAALRFCLKFCASRLAHRLRLKFERFPANPSLQPLCTCESTVNSIDSAYVRRPVMHFHTNQINPNAQLNELYAAARAAATQGAARTRKKLLEFASEVAGESDSGDACVVRLGAREESQEQAKQQNQGSRQKQKGGADSENSGNSISDWV
jgi:hypothetical protein